MRHIRKKIISAALSLLVLVTGNFAYAVTHLDCITGEYSHHTCEMECCQESDCCSEEEKAVEIKDEFGCCKVHVEQSTETEYPLPVINNTIEKLKTEPLKINYSASELSSENFSLSSHKLKTTNIYLTVSNLRI